LLACFGCCWKGEEVYVIKKRAAILGRNLLESFLSLCGCKIGNLIGDDQYNGGGCRAAKTERMASSFSFSPAKEI